MLDFIANPMAGGVSGRRSRKAIDRIKCYLDEKGVEYTFHFTAKPRHAIELTQNLIANGSTDIIAIGGDGTLHEVLNGFSNFENVNLGLIPCGTGNDFANALNLPTDPIEALDIILNGKPVYVDFMQMPTVRGINVIGMGIDVEVLKRYRRLKKKTKFGYTKSLILTLFKFKYTDFDIYVGDEPKQTQRAFITAVANGYRFGGGLEVCPTASPTDNMLDFVSVKEMNKLKLINAFIKVKQKKVLTLKQTIHKQAKKVVVKTACPYTVNVDGELYENIPFEIEIVSNTLKMYK